MGRMLAQLPKAIPMGVFAEKARELAEFGLTVVPVSQDTKKPAVRWPSRKIGPSSTFLDVMINRFGDCNIGILTKLSGVTVVDIDDSNLVQSMLDRFGPAKIVVGTPSGGTHLFYKYNGESCRNLRDSEGIKVDIKAGGSSNGGFVLAPPSQRRDGKYYFILQGDWSDLADLPTILPGSLPEHIPVVTRNSAGISQDNRPSDIGTRNNRMLRHLLRFAKGVTIKALVVEEAHRLNATLNPPLTTAEVEKTADRAWGYEESGQNLVGKTQRLYHQADELKATAGNVTAFYFLQFLRSIHGWRTEPFYVSPVAMWKAGTISGWGKHSYITSLDCLVDLGLLIRVHESSGRKGDASRYIFGQLKDQTH